MEKLKFILRYIIFYFSSGNEHSIHSPFVFDLYTSVIKSKKQYYIFKEIEKLRAKLKNNKNIISIKDYGAGSLADDAQRRRISDIAKSAEKPKKIGQLLFRLVEYTKPKLIFDLGTSFGISTLYLASANASAEVITFEGCPETITIAVANFKKLNNNTIELCEGNIDHSLSKELLKIQKLDMVFFDANHRYKPTMDYFKQCLSKAHEGTVLIFDDIYWSEEMMQAWKEIKEDPAVMLTIDLFFIGLVFFRKDQPKQHFKLRT